MSRKLLTLLSMRLRKWCDQNRERTIFSVNLAANVHTDLPLRRADEARGAADHPQFWDVQTGVQECKEGQESEDGRGHRYSQQEGECSFIFPPVIAPCCSRSFPPTFFNWSRLPSSSLLISSRSSSTTWGNLLPSLLREISPSIHFLQSASSSILKHKCDAL